MPTRFFSVLMLVSAVASADPSAADRAKAKASFGSAQKEYDLGDFKAALTDYTEAYRLDPRPPFLFNIAQCHRQLADFERAVFFYNRFLSHYGAGKAPNDALAHELLAESEKKLAEQRAPAPAPTPAVPSSDAPVASGSLTPDPFPLPPVVPAPEPETNVREGHDGIVHQWWFWTIIGVVVVGGITGAAIGVTQHHNSTERMTTLPDLNFQ